MKEAIVITDVSVNTSIQNPQFNQNKVKYPVHQPIVDALNDAPRPTLEPESKEAVINRLHRIMDERNKSS